MGNQTRVILTMFSLFGLYSLKPTTEAGIGISTMDQQVVPYDIKSPKKSNFRFHGDAPKGVYCKARYVNYETGDTLILRISEISEDQASNCDCQPTTMFFGTHYLPAPEGYHYAAGCEVVYPKARRPTEPGKVTYYDFRKPN